jgi:hypothetical protein
MPVLHLFAQSVTLKATGEQRKFQLGILQCLVMYAPTFEGGDFQAARLQALLDRMRKGNFESRPPKTRSVRIG